MGVYKCNTDGSSKENPGPSSWAFCVRDYRGNFKAATTSVTPNTNSLCAEARAIERGMEFCVRNQFLPLVIETDSLAMKQIIDGNWHIPWSLSMEIRKIQEWKKKENIKIEHTMREENQVADF